MLPKYIPVLLVVFGLIAFASAGICENRPTWKVPKCTIYPGKFLYTFGKCVEHGPVRNGAGFVKCMEPDDLFDTEEECKEVCKEEIQNYTP